MDVLYVVERDTAAFEAARTTVDIVCAGDSLTGWNNFGPAEQWPYRTYPDFLQELCVPLGLRVANGGIAGEISDNGPQQVRDYLDLFPNARYFVIGMGTNDLGTWPDTEATSRRIIGNLGRMVQMVRGPRQTADPVQRAARQRGDVPALHGQGTPRQAGLPQPTAEVVLRRTRHPVGRHLLPAAGRAFWRRVASE